MVYDYVTDTFGLSSQPGRKKKPKSLTPARVFGGEQIVLSRALCSFEARALPSNLQGEKLRRVMELTAKTSSPHEEPGIFILVGNKYASIWTYDATDLTEKHGLSIRKIVPESALHAPSDGAVLRKVLEGYEGQFWKDGELLASRWWSGEVTPVDWQRFCLAAERFGATETPLPDVMLPVKRARAIQNHLLLLSQMARLSAGSWLRVAVSVMCVAILYLGTHMLALDLSYDQMQMQYERLWTEKSAQRQSALRLKTLERKNASVSRLFNIEHPLPALSIALSQALRDNGRIEDIFYDSYIFEISFTSSTNFSQRSYVAELEQSPFISDVTLVQGQRPNLWELTFSHMEGATK